MHLAHVYWIGQRQIVCDTFLQALKHNVIIWPEQLIRTSHMLPFLCYCHALHQNTLQGQEAL